MGWIQAMGINSVIFDHATAIMFKLFLYALDYQR